MSPLTATLKCPHERGKDRVESEAGTEVSGAESGRGREDVAEAASGFLAIDFSKELNKMNQKCLRLPSVPPIKGGRNDFLLKFLLTGFKDSR